MITNSDKSAGISLLLGSFFMIITMVLHPVGGDFNQLQKIVVIGMVSHAIAILAIPFMALGYFGISMRLKEEAFFSRIAFSVMLFGLFAVMIAGAANGIVLMDLVRDNKDASELAIESLKPIIRYNFHLNHAFDYIFIGAVFLSTLLWSVSMIQTGKFPKWIAYFGIGMVTLAFSMLVFGFVFLDVAGFRIFIFGTAGWTIASGLYLINGSSE